MGHINEYEKCCRFLHLNGFKIEAKTDEFMSFEKAGHYGVDVSKDEIVFIDDSGDFLHMDVSYYALIGAMMEMRQITAGYITALTPEQRWHV